MGHKHTAGSEFKTDRQVEVIRKNSFLISLPIAISILVDKELIVGERIARAIVRVGRHGGDPEAALVVKRDLHWIGEIGELFLGSEERDLVAFRS